MSKSIGSASSEELGKISEKGKSTPKRKRSVPQSTDGCPAKSPSLANETFPRSYTNEGQICSGNGFGKVLNGHVICSPKSQGKKLAGQFSSKSEWNPRDPAQTKAVKEALHVATTPSNVVCREEEQQMVIEFCKVCIEQERSGSLYVCGCPGTGKTLSINKVKEYLSCWSKEVGHQPLEALAINCTSLTNTSEIFNRILEKLYPYKKKNGSLPPLRILQSMFSQRSCLLSGTMLLAIIDEMDYLITKDRAVLHDLFMLTTFPFCRFILIGIANSIDLADRFLPKLESLNCKPFTVTFCAYSRDQILEVLQERLKVLGYEVFKPSALEYCASRVAAASGDMRKVLDACRAAIEVLEAALRGSSTKEEAHIVTADHMEIALSKAFNSTKIDIIQSLPQHQQIILCSIVKLFHSFKKNATTIAELNRSYMEVCKSASVPAAGSLEFTDMCRVLSDQGLLKLGQSKENRLKRVTLQIDISDVSFAFKGIRFFHNCLKN